MLMIKATVITAMPIGIVTYSYSVAAPIENES